MKIRNLVITVAVLAALSAVAFLRSRPRSAPASDPRVGTAVLDSDTASRAAGLTVSDQGKKVELARGADGAWRVTSYFDLPADFDKIARFVQDLNESKVDRFVTSSPDRIGRMEFKDSAVSLRDSGGKEIWGVTLGKTPENGNGRFIRFGAEPRAYFSGMHVWLDTDAKGWANPQIVPMKPDEVVKIEIGFGEGAPVEVTRARKDAPWAAAAPPPGKKLSPDKVAPVLASLTALRFSDTSEASDPAAAEAAKSARTFRLTASDGRTVSVTLGRKPEEKRLKAPVADAKEALVPQPGVPGEKPEPKPIAPEMETVPAGPVFAVVSSSDAKAPVNEMMRRRSFKVDDYAFTGLPQKADELFEDVKAK